MSSALLLQLLLVVFATVQWLYATCQFPVFTFTKSVVMSHVGASGDQELLDQAVALVVSAEESGAGLGAIPADIRGAVLELAVKSGNSTAYSGILKAYLKV